MAVDLKGCYTPRRANDQLTIKEAAAACLHSLKLLVSSHSSAPSEALQEQEQQQPFGEIAHQGACKIRKVLSLLDRTGHARFRRGPIEPLPFSHAPVAPPPPPPPPASLTVIVPLSTAPTSQPQSRMLEVTKPNLSMSGATSRTPMSFFSLVIGGGESMSLKRSQVSSGKPPLSRHKRKPYVGANSEATTNGIRCHCSKRRKNRVKRTIRVPTVSTKIADIPPDEYSWYKYGQKSIKGSPYPRGYYKCSTMKGCLARKHVERANDDLAMLMVTYKGEHHHTPETLAPLPAPMPMPMAAAVASVSTIIGHS